ncbi:MAG: serpin family protein [Pseudomonadota bacterium]|nr:serpin family protein [Pseudomonadota bacterium]
MAQVLHFNLEQQPFHNAFCQLQQQLAQNSSGVLLNSANALWIEQTLDLLEDFVKVNQDNYQGGVYSVDFFNETEAVRLKINAWVEEKTQGKIEDILAAGELNSLTRLVLVNALYFKGGWVYPFEPEFTKQMSFWVTPEQDVEVSMMQVEEYFNYVEDDNIQIIEFYYGKSCSGDEWDDTPVLAIEDFSMLVFLPKKRDGLFELEPTLNAARCEQRLNQMTQAKVSVFLPKFKLTDTFELSQVLEQMGMADAFCEQADFSGINGTQALFISKIIHKTRLSSF